jgi:hypothetical protein
VTVLPHNRRLPQTRQRCPLRSEVWLAWSPRRRLRASATYLSRDEGAANPLATRANLRTARWAVEGLADVIIVRN